MIKIYPIYKKFLCEKPDKYKTAELILKEGSVLLFYIYLAKYITKGKVKNLDGILTIFLTVS